MTTEEKKDSLGADDSWDAGRERLLASLRDCGVQRAPRYPIWNHILGAFVMLVTIAIARLAAAGINDLSRGPEGVMALIIGYPLLFIFAVVVLARVRNLFLRRAWQAGAKSAETEISQSGSRRPILYLRSFALDEKLARKSWLEVFLGTVPLKNAEQMVTAFLRRIGPVIAIGRPGEKLPALGAARFYVSHELWQDKVVDVVKESQVVLWASGLTEGLRWEISHLIENLKPEQLLLWAHPSLEHRSMKKREEEWKRFRETLGAVFPKPLPEKLGDARFFVFDHDWNATPVTPNYWKLLYSRQLTALQKALSLMPLPRGGGRRFHPRTSKALYSVWNLIRIAAGIALVASILGMATAKVCRQWELGSFGSIPFTMLSIGLGLGVSLFVSGLAAVFRRPMKWTWSLLLIPIIAGVYAILIPMMGSPWYWQTEEKSLWVEAQTNPSQVQYYAYIPAKFKRRESYEFLTNWLEKRAAKQRTDSEFWFDDDVKRMIDEIDRAHSKDDELQGLKKRLQALIEKG